MSKYEIKYIYFEVKHRTGVDPSDPEIINENALLFKPHTNSCGVWGFTHMTERCGLTQPSFVIVDQNWVDLDKFDVLYDIKLKRQVKEVIERLKLKYDNL